MMEIQDGVVGIDQNSVILTTLILICSARESDLCGVMWFALLSFTNTVVSKARK